MFPVIEKAEELTGRPLRHEPRGRRPVPGRRRPRAQLDDADRRRRHPRQRGPRLRAAPAAAARRTLDAAARRTRTASLPELLPGQPRQDGRDLHRAGHRLGAHLDVAYAEEDAFRQTLRTGTTIFDVAAQDAKAGGGTQLSGEQGVRPARHLRLPDRPDPRDGVRAGPLRRRGRVPPADDRAARPRQGGRAGRRRASTPTRTPTARSPTDRPRRSSSPATPRSSPRRPCAASSAAAAVVTVGRARATRSSWCWTAPRSTPRAAASSPTRA